MKKHLLKVMGLVVLLALLVGATPLAAEQAEPAGPINSLRVYGKAYEWQDPFPYTEYTQPYDLTSWAAPPKDFVQFNPAFIHVFFDDMGRYLKCGYDAAEKVHARMWYQPKYMEPRGLTHPMVRDPAFTHDIVFEYTYTMLNEDTLDPVPCEACETQMVFPMVGGVAPGFPNEQLGLEGYDVNNDGHNEVLKLEEIRQRAGTQSTIVVSPKSTSGAMRLHKGDVIEFFDYAVKIIDEPTTTDLKVEVAIYYTGWKHNHWDFVGQTSLWLHDKASVDARHGPVRPISSPEFWRVPTPVIRPFWIEATYVGTDFVTIKPYRILTAGETFFVDGAEYDVAAIFTEAEGLKYITLRNPLPKGEGDIFINDISVYKRRVPMNTSLPMLPPYNMVHDEIDDTNIPDCATEDPDGQYPDNVGWNGNPCGPDELHDDYDTILERVMLDTPPYDGAAGDPYSYIAWIEETKEPRFDTSLMEEKILEIFWPGGKMCRPILRYVEEELTQKKEWAGLWYYGITSETPADVNDPAGLGPEDVHVYVNGVEVPVIEVNEADANPGQYYVALEQDFPDANEGPDPVITITYMVEDQECFQTPRFQLEEWQWINIETHPWDYTEFILPMRPDVTDPDNEDGDYILVGSWITEDSFQNERGPVRMKFVYDAAVNKTHSADIYVNDAEYNQRFRGVAENSLRVYGNCGEGAAFPYLRFDGPFNIGNANWEKPLKDFVVHNPALLNHLDPDMPLYSNIIADEDAHEKVHLRTWYDPCYPEPRGETDPMVPQIINPLGDIVNEYTYVLLDDATLDPTHGSYDRTQMVFPMAGLGGQVGLDRYDVNGDGTDEIMSVERVEAYGWPYCMAPTPEGEIIVSPEPVDAGNMQIVVEDGEFGGPDTLEFLDYAIVLVDTASNETRALFDVYYLGYRYGVEDYVGQVELFGGPFGLVNNTAVVDAGDPPSITRHGYWDHPLDDIAEAIQAVDKPFAFLIDHVSTNYVSIKPFRVLTAGETFFVDGAEYDVAAIGVVPGDTFSEAHGAPLCELKYITLRNPLPKGDGEFFIPKLTRWKVRFGDQEILPVLPPFNHEHDIVDDVNIPDCLVGRPDWQAPDNIGAPGCYGSADYLHDSYDEILERLVEDQPPFEFWWLAEEKEERFDTSYTEEKWKFTEGGEKWQWINIETKPWYFTEFVLPEIPEAPGLEGMGYMGDFILVSSFITEDGVRVKFSYDASNGTGLYVNSDLCEPARVLSVSSNSPVDQYGTVQLLGVVNAETDEFAWDFGGLTGCTGEDTLTPTCDADVAGEFEVTLTAKNECAEHTEATTVVVEKCPGDFAPDFGFRDLADIMAMLPAWNTDCGDAAYDDIFDFDGDCHIGLFDIMQVVAVWNTPCPGGTP